jgi:hypothetical protein
MPILVTSFRRALAVFYAGVLVISFSGSMLAFITYSKSTTKAQFGTELTSFVFTTPDCRSKPTIEGQGNELVLRMEVDEYDNFQVNQEFYAWADWEIDPSLSVYIHRTSLLRTASLDDVFPARKQPWGFPDRLDRGPTGPIFVSKAATYAPVLHTTAIFNRPFDSYFGGFTAVAIAAQRPEPGLLHPFFAQLRGKEVPIATVRIIPPRGYVAKSVHNPEEMSPIEINVNDHEFLSQSCDIYLFELIREPAEVWFGTFLLTLAFLPIVLLILNESAHGVEFIGAIVALGAIRIVLVGDDRSPYFVDLVLGAVLLLVALYWVLPNARSRVDIDTPSRGKALFRKWPRMRRRNRYK